MSRFLGQLGVMLAKDLRIELRTREVLYTSVLFSVVLITLFIFSGFESREIAQGAAPGVLWVSTAFVGVLIFGRTFQREREHRAVAGLLLVPRILDALFASKLLLNMLMLAAVQALLVPMVLATFHIGAVSWAGLLLFAFLGNLGFCALGTVLAASLSTIRLKEALLPMLLFPLSIPLLVAAVQGTAACFEGEGADAWMSIMVAFDAIFVVLARWLFGEAVDSGEV